MRMNETINTMPEYERLRADYEKRLQEVEQNYQKQLIQMADEAKRANMAKTDFLRRMSHDMRTPINAINGYVRIAGAFPDDQVKQPEGRMKLTGTFEIQPDADSPIYVICGGEAYEAFAQTDGFGAYVPAQPEAIVYYVGGDLLMFDIV